MDKLLNFVNIERAREIMVGGDLDVANYDDTQALSAALIAFHCMLNGPVGVNKVTTFPVLGTGSIKTLVDSTATNRTWSNTVRLLAQHITNDPQWAGVVRDCQQYRLHKTVWPLWDRKNGGGN